jgi:hypothetical protein
MTLQPYTSHVNGFIHYKHMAETAAKAANSAAHGVCVTVDYFNGEYKFVIWTFAPKVREGLIKHELFAEVTNQERLNAHVKGFAQQYERYLP